MIIVFSLPFCSLKVKQPPPWRAMCSNGPYKSVVHPSSCRDSTTPQSPATKWLPPQSLTITQLLCTSAFAVAPPPTPGTRQLRRRERRWRPYRCAKP